jgi:hypothetical protein
VETLTELAKTKATTFHLSNRDAKRELRIKLEETPCHTYHPQLILTDSSPKTQEINSFNDLQEYHVAHQLYEQVLSLLSIVLQSMLHQLGVEAPTPRNWMLSSVTP